MTDTKTITLPDKIKSTNTLLAALRLLQTELDKNPEGHGLELFGELLSVDEINELCESINFGAPLDSIDEEELSADEIYDRAHQIKSIMSLHYHSIHPYEIAWKTAGNKGFEYDGLMIHHNRYVAMNFILRSNAIVEDETNTDAYVKTTFTIDAKELSLSAISTLSCCETGDACDLPVSLALQKEVNAACDSMIKEQLAVLSKNNIHLLSVDTKNDWTDASLLETAFNKFEKLRNLLNAYYANHPYLKNEDSTDSDIRLDFQSNVDGDFLSGNFLAVLNYKPDTAPLDKDGNRTSVGISCRTFLNKGDHEDFNYKVNTSFAASLLELNTGYYISDIEVPALLHKEITVLCETIAEAQQAFLASHGIESSANPVTWNFVASIAAEDTINEDEESSMGLS